MSSSAWSGAIVAVCLSWAAQAQTSLDPAAQSPAPVSAPGASEPTAQTAAPADTEPAARTSASASGESTTPASASGASQSATPSASSATEPVTQLSAPASETPVPPPAHAARLLGREISAGAGVLGSSFGFVGGRWGDLFTTQHVEGRWVLYGLTVEAGVMHALPLVTGGASQSVTGHLRAGWTTDRLTATVGLSAQYGFTAQPQLQYLPTVRAAYAFDRFGLSAGVFDVHALAIARVSAELGDYGLGFVAPLGAEAHARFRLGDFAALRVQALAFRAMQAQYAFLSVSGVWEPDAVQGGAR